SIDVVVEAARDDGQIVRRRIEIHPSVFTSGEHFPLRGPVHAALYNDSVVMQDLSRCVIDILVHEGSERICTTPLHGQIGGRAEGGLFIVHPKAGESVVLTTLNEAAETCEQSKLLPARTRKVVELLPGSGDLPFVSRCKCIVFADR